MKDVFKWPLAVLAPLAVTAGHAAEDLEARIEQLERRFDEQQRLLERQRHRIEAQRAVIARQAKRLDAAFGSADIVSAPAAELSRFRGADKAAQVSSQTSPQPVGVAPPQTPRPKPQLQALPEVGGVLTTKGALVLEPSLQFSNSQVNRLTFVGIEILEAFQIGLLEAQDADRDLYSAAMAVRYGLTNRLELEAKLPYIYRSDRVAATIPSVTGNPQITRDLSNGGIGDLELAAHYQLNAGRDGWPVFIGNLRYKAPTGKGPFDVSRNADGIETELATGSGFHSLEPSVTVLYPSDPAVFYANLGYLFNLKDDINKTFGDQTIGEVDPGDALRVSFGMGYSINQRASFSIGYKHDFIQRSKTEINGVKLSSGSLDVGALLLGYGFQLNPKTAINLNLELGVTADAPDVVVTLRAPFQW